jgi:hypothetical protein
MTADELRAVYRTKDELYTHLIRAGAYLPNQAACDLHLLKAVQN